MSGEYETYGQDPYATGQHTGYGGGPPLDPYAQEPQPGYSGYDAYGQPQSYELYGQQTQAYYQDGAQAQPYAYPYPYAQDQDPQQDPQQDPDQDPQQGPPQDQDPSPEPQESHEPEPDGEAASAENPFEAEQFAFIEEENDKAEDVIDWLKFSESRTERRDERKRRDRKRIIVLAAVLAVVLVGGVGYALQGGLFSGSGAASATVAQASDGQKRDVIVVNLRVVNSNDSATALLVHNETAGTGAAVLLPNSLTVSTDTGGSTTLANSVVQQGAAPTRDALNTLLGAGITGTWRLDTPFLEILVNSVGDIRIDTNATVKASAQDGGKTLVTPGKQQQLDGQAAVAYASYRAPGEPQQTQLARFAQVLQGVLAQLPTDAAGATKIVDAMGAIPDPSLSDAQLGAVLAQLAGDVGHGRFQTSALPVRADGTLSSQATGSVVRDVLGGTVGKATVGSVPTVAVRNATGSQGAATSAQIAVVNSGYSYVDGGTVATQGRSQILYSSDAQAQAAHELAKTLGLPDGEVARGQGQSGAGVTVILGTDYKGQG